MADKGSKPGIARRKGRDDEDEDDDRPPVGDDDRDDEDEDDRPTRRKGERSRYAPAPEHESNPMLLIGLIAAFVLGFIIIACGIGYLMWPSPTPPTSQVNPDAPPTLVAAAEPPKNLDEIIPPAPERPAEVAGPPPGRPDFELPKFDPPEAGIGPRPVPPPGKGRPPAVRPRAPAGPGAGKPKPALAGPKFLPVEPLPIDPAPLASTRVERALPGPVENMVVAGGGRLLLLHMPRERRVAVFDVSKGDRVKLIPAEDPGAMVAGGMNLFVIYLPARKVLEWWSTKTLEREAELKTEFAGEVRALAMGLASNGPLVAAVGGGRKAPLGGATLAYFDPATGKEVHYEVAGQTNGFGLGIHNARAVVRVSADGSLVAGWGDNGQGGTQTEVIAGGRITRHWQFDWLDSVVPGPDGRTLYGKGMRHPPDLKVEGNRRQDHDNPVWLIPAAHGEYFVSLRTGPAEKRNPRPTARKALAEICLGEEGKSFLSVGELPNFELPTGFIDSRGKTFDQLVALVPDAKVLAVVPTRRPDRVLLIRADLEAALARAGFDHLTVTSRAPTVVFKGEVFKYAVSARSKKGGIKVTLDSGPPGMAVTPAGAVTWNVPRDFADPEAGVILRLTDAGGTEQFHSFRLTVLTRDEKSASPKGK